MGTSRRDAVSSSSGSAEEAPFARSSNDYCSFPFGPEEGEEGPPKMASQPRSCVSAGQITCLFSPGFSSGPAKNKQRGMTCKSLGHLSTKTDRANDLMSVHMQKSILFRNRSKHLFEISRQMVCTPDGATSSA